MNDWKRPGLMAILMATAGAVQAEETVYPAIGQVHRFSPDLDTLLPRDAVIERLTEDTFTWSEGPVWVPAENYLLFTDVPGNTAWKWSGEGGLEVFLKPSSLDGASERDAPGPGANGLMLSAEGDLLMCDHGSRSVLTLDLATKERKVLAGEFEGRRFNSPNDLAVSSVRWPGAVFFTDPPYGLKGQDDSPLKELPFNGIYRLDPDGAVTLLDDSMERPNGIALSPDEKTLYVANSHKPRALWMAFDLDQNGNVAGEGRVFASAQKWADEGARGLPDGMVVDRHGRLWATGPGGVFVIDPQGRILGLIETGTAIANCTLGGPQGSTLYMTSHSFLARVETGL